MDDQLQYAPLNHSYKEYQKESSFFSLSSEPLNEGHQSLQYQEELNAIADEMTRRNNNVGFIIGSFIRKGIDNLFIPSFKWAYHFAQQTYNSICGLFFSENEVAASDITHDVKEPSPESKNQELDSLLRNYRPFNTDYPVLLTDNQSACMSLDSHFDRRYNEKIKIYHNQTEFFKNFTDTTIMHLKNQYFQETKVRLDSSLKHYQNFAQFDYEFVSDWTEANVKTELYDDAAAADQNFWARAHLPPFIQTKYTFKATLDLTSNLLNYHDSIRKNNCLEHELGHLIIGLHHPFDAFKNVKNLTQSQRETIKTIGNMLDHPEWSIMTYTKKGKVVEYFDSGKRPKSLLTHKGVAFCESVVAYAKYGSPIANKEKNVHVRLQEDTYLSSVIPATGAKSLHLDASEMHSPVQFVLESSFKPTQFKNGQFFIPPDISIIQVTTSKWADHIYIGPQDNYVSIIGGSPKTLIIQPSAGAAFVTGFRSCLDRVIFQGPDFSKQTINMTHHDSSTVFTFGTNGKLNLKSSGSDCTSRKPLEVHFDPEVKDGVHYLLNLYNNPDSVDMKFDEVPPNDNDEPVSLGLPEVLAVSAVALGFCYKMRSKFNRPSFQNTKTSKNTFSDATGLWHIDRDNKRFIRMQ